jgi:hypothetical protein
MNELKDGEKEKYLARGLKIEINLHHTDKKNQISNK